MANLGQELLNVPFPEMVEGLGTAISRAQLALDGMSLRIAQMMSGAPYEMEQENAKGETVLVERPATRVKFGDGDYSLLELGFTPSFYQFVDTTIEVKISINIQEDTERKTSSYDMTTSLSASGSVSLNPFKPKTSAKMRLSVSSVSASYSNKYSYSAEGSSLIRTRLVPVPVPAVLEERLQALVAAEASTPSTPATT